MRLPVAIGAWAAGVAVAPRPEMRLALAAPPALGAFSWWVISKAQRWVMLFVAAAIALPPLPIPMGNSGPHPCLLLGVLGVFCGLLHARWWRVRLAGIASALAALSGILLLSLLPAAAYSGWEIAAGSLARVGLFGLAVYVYFYARFAPGARIEPFRAVRILYALAVASALFACVDFAYQFPAPAGFGPQFVWLDSGVYRRAQGIFYEASTLGNFCAFFLVMIAAALARGERTLLPRAALLVGAAVFLTALVLSFSRASLLNVLISSIALVSIERKRLGRIAIAAAGGLATVCLLFPAFAATYWMRLSASAEYFLSSPNGVLSGRLNSWGLVLDAIAREPQHLLLGVGYKTLPYTSYFGDPITADNMYLSLLIETGVVGLAALIWLNAAVLRAALRASRAADRRTAFLGVWIFCFWCGQCVQMLSGDLLTYWRVLALYLWVMALME